VAAPDESVVLVDGPWTHRTLSANGQRFHVAETGSGPLVLLLHGFPEFWWSWRHQLVALAAAGFRAVAPDLRGYGASDKPPRGYDAFTLSSDVAGMVRALGEERAVVVGHDWGGFLAWCTAALHPAVVSRLVVIGMPHPLRLRAALLTDVRGQLTASRHVLAFQRPWIPERQLVRDRAAYVGRLLRGWSGTASWPDEETERRCREAMRIPGVAHSALEYYRWLVRSLPRPDGMRLAARVKTPVRAATLQVHGALDQCLFPRSAVGSGRYVAADYTWRLLEGVGHFPHEEDPTTVGTELLRWLHDDGG
jgi:pimeloyl-ACP methyl ester carboxylesterase